MSEAKPCKGCFLIKPLHRFHNDRKAKDGKFGKCIDCSNEDKRKWREGNQAAREYQERWRRENADRLRDTRLRRDFGIGLDEYNQILAGQGFGCAVCGSPDNVPDKNGRPRNLAVDHDHRTGEIRGLLCNPCNLGIGYFFDDAERLQWASNYMHNWDSMHPYDRARGMTSHA